MLIGSPSARKETTNVEDKGFSPICGEGALMPQTISANGSMIIGDNHFTAGGDGEVLTDMDHQAMPRLKAVQHPMRKTGPRTRQSNG